MKTRIKIALIIVSTVAFLLLAAGTLLTLRYFEVIGPRTSKKQFLKEVEDLKIPIVEINTDGSISKTDEYTNCSFSISNCEKQEYNFSLEKADEPSSVGGVGIRVRGKTTSNGLKQPYRIKFNEKTSILGMRKNKSWVLLSDYYDQSYIRNYTAFSLAKNFDYLDFTPTPNHVALFVNGSFKGLYLLCEQIDEEKGRLDIEEKNETMTASDKDYPLHLVIESSLENGLTPQHDYFMVDWAYVELKYPDYKDRTEIYKGQEGDPIYDYAKEYMSAVFKALNTGERVSVSFSDTPLGLEDLVDINSMIDYYLVTEILLNCDSCKRSLHLHKEKGGKLKFGPVWDFDWSLSCGHWDLPYTQSNIEDAQKIEIARRSRIFSRFMQNETYYQMVSARFNEKKDTILNVANMLKDYKGTIKSTALIDANKWHGNDGESEFTLQYDYVRLFLYDRYTFLNYAFSLSHKEFLNLK